MDEHQSMEDRLWDYIDGMPNAAEKSAIDELIATNRAWRNRYQELLEAHQLINGSALEVPSLRFSKNVMEAIAKYHVAPATRSYINKKIIWGIGGFFLAMIVGLLIYAFAQVNWSNGGSSNLLSQYDPGRINWSKIFNNTSINIFIMVNIVLGLMLLDMYLHRRKERATQKEA